MSSESQSMISAEDRDVIAAVVNKRFYVAEDAHGNRYIELSPDYTDTVDFLLDS